MSVGNDKQFITSGKNGDVIITFAVTDPTAGKKGISAFIVPKINEDGTTNGYRVWRLKDKIGPRSMASGEINLEGAKAYHMGPVEDGFRNMMRYVVHTSRLYNAVSSVAGMRRATITAPPHPPPTHLPIQTRKYLLPRARP